MKKLVLTGLLLTLTHSLFAEDKSFLGEAIESNHGYNFVEVAYVDVDVDNDDLDADLDGFKVHGSFDMDPNFAVIASITSLSEKDVDVDYYSGGVAFHQGIPGENGEGVDVVAHASIEAIRFDPDNAKSDTKYGALFGAGIRYLAIDNLEVFGDLSIRTAGDNDIILKGGARYTFVQGFSAFAAIEVADSEVLSTGIRYTF